MKSIKPGRGPSFMSGIVGIFMIGFGLLWTVLAAQASGIMALFGILWTGVAIATTVYNFKNATGKNRYSQYDITDAHEEPDPFNERFGGVNHNGEQSTDRSDKKSAAFCPYCGSAVESDYEFCPKCGEKLP